MDRRRGFGQISGRICFILFLVAFANFQDAVFAADISLPDDKKKEEEKKEKPFKYSAWCAFRDLSSIKPPPTKVDPQTEHTRPSSWQWEGFGRHGQWATVVLELKNTTEDKEYRGTATITLNPLKRTDAGVDTYTTTYRQDFEIGPQTEKQYLFSVMCPIDGWTEPITINISANGRSFDPRQVTLHDLDALREDLIVVVSETSGAFRFLGTNNKQGEEPADKGRRVAVVDPLELPSRWHDLMMANLIILDGPPREKLSEAQYEALKSYVQAGGHILITAGRDPSRLSGPIESLVGMKVREMVDVAGLTGGPAPELNFKPDKADTKLTIVDVDVLGDPQNRPIVRYDNQLKHVEQITRNYGPGSVTFLPYSLGDPLLEKWEGRSIIPLNIIDDSRERSLFSSRGEDDLASGPVRDPRNPYQYYEVVDVKGQTLSTLRHNLDESFSTDTPVQMQPANYVLSFLLFYLLCAVPINYFIFGWFKRREIAWLAVPVWSLTFSIMAYVVGYMGQTGQMTVNEVSVIEAGPGQGVGMARTFMGLYAPIRGDYRIEFSPIKGKEKNSMFETQAAPGHLVTAAARGRQNIENPELYLADGSGGLQIERLKIQQRSTRRLEVVHRATLGDGLAVKVSREGGKLKAEVTNNTGRALFYPTLIVDARQIQLATQGSNVLPPGATKTISDENFTGGTPPDFFSIQVVMPSARGQAATNRGKALNDFLRAQMDKYASPEQAVVCAWVDSDRGYLPMKISAGSDEAREPRIDGLTMLVVPTRVREKFDDSTLPKSTVFYSHDYQIMTDQGNWQEVKGPSRTQLLRDSKSKQLPPPAAAYLKVKLPPRYRAYARDGMQMRLALALELAQISSTAQRNGRGAVLDGDVEIQVKRLKSDTRPEWAELAAPPTSQLQMGSPVALKTFALPITNPRTISADGSIILKVTYTPNQALEKIVTSYTLNLIVKRCEACRREDEDK